MDIRDWSRVRTAMLSRVVNDSTLSRRVESCRVVSRCVDRRHRVKSTLKLCPKNAFSSIHFDPIPVFGLIACFKMLSITLVYITTVHRTIQCSRMSLIKNNASI